MSASKERMYEPSPNGPVEKFLRLTEVRSRVPYSRASIYRLISAGKFPAPYALDASGRAVAWKDSEIRAFIDSRQRVSIGKLRPTKAGGRALTGRADIEGFLQRKDPKAGE
jgi:prophage regulatory protein